MITSLQIEEFIERARTGVPLFDARSLANLNAGTFQEQ